MLDQFGHGDLDNIVNEVLKVLQRRRNPFRYSPIKRHLYTDNNCSTSKTNDVQINVVVVLYGMVTSELSYLTAPANILPLTNCEQHKHVYHQETLQESRRLSQMSSTAHTIRPQMLWYLKEQRPCRRQSCDISPVLQSFDPLSQFIKIRHPWVHIPPGHFWLHGHGPNRGLRLCLRAC